MKTEGDKGKEQVIRRLIKETKRNGVEQVVEQVV